MSCDWYPSSYATALIDYMRSHGADVELVEKAMRNRGVDQSLQRTVLERSPGSERFRLRAVQVLRVIGERIVAILPRAERA